MGYCVYEGLLLDEKDIAGALDTPIKSFDQLCEVLQDWAICEVGCPEGMEQEVLGFASERFNTGTISPGLRKAEYVLHGAPWNATIAYCCSSFSYIDPDILNQFLVDEDVDLMSRHLKQLTQSHLDAEEYDWARDKLVALANLAAAGLPGFQSYRNYRQASGTGLYDMRHRNHGRGTRILIEFRYAWW